MIRWLALGACAVWLASGAGACACATTRDESAERIDAEMRCEPFRRDSPAARGIVFNEMPARYRVDPFGWKPRPRRLEVPGRRVGRGRVDRRSKKRIPLSP